MKRVTIEKEREGNRKNNKRRRRDPDPVHHLFVIEKLYQKRILSFFLTDRGRVSLCLRKKLSFFYSNEMMDEESN